MLRRKKLAIALLGLVFLVSIFWMGRASVRISSCIRNAQDVEILIEYKSFEKLAQNVQGFLMKRDGRIPPDLYKALVNEGVVSSYSEFILSGNAILFDSMALPCRINTDLPKNARAPLFWVLRPDIQEIWVCYLNGSCERETRGSTLDIKGMSSFGKAQSTWLREFHSAGYPYWASLQDKEQWCEDNYDRLEWDSERGFYVPQN